MNHDIDRFRRTLVRESADAVIYADAKGLIAFWNKRAERIFGFPEAEALEKSLDIIIPEKSAKSSLGRLQRDYAQRQDALRRRGYPHL
jgi:PAS domain S-box-containing protein